MPYIEVRLEDLLDGSPTRVEHDGFGIVVVRRGNAVHAFEDFCPHAGWRLSDGEATDDHVECPGHGWKFELGTGQCTDVPFYRLRRLTVEVKEGVALLSWEAMEGEGEGAKAL